MLQKGPSGLKCILWILLVLKANFGLCQACPNSIKGRINSFSDHLPIAFAQVYLSELKISTITDSLGYFQFCDVPEGKKHLIIKQLGFDSLSIFIDPGKKRVTIHLKEKQQWLDAIDVRGQHRHFESEVVESHTIHAEELLQNRGVSLGELVRKTPGVSSIQTGPTIFKPVIQGLTGNRIAIVSNGVKLEGQQWGFDHAPELDPNLADEITIIKGAQAIRFGTDAIGGSILLEPGKIETNRLWQGRSTTGFFSNGKGFFQNAMLQKSFGTHNQGAFRMTINARNSGDFSTAKYVLGNTAMKEFSGLLLGRYSFGKLKTEVSLEVFQSELGIFSGSHISTPEGIRNAFKRPDSSYKYAFGYKINRPSQEIRHLVGKSKLEYQLDENSKFQFIYSHQIDDRKEFDIIRKSARCQTCPQLEFELFTNQADFSYKYSKDAFENQSGIVGFFQSNNTQRSNLIPDFNMNQFSIYSINYWYRSKWAYEVGFRSEIRNLHIFQNVGSEQMGLQRQYVNVMANAGARFEISDHWHTKLNFQYSRRAPNVNEMFSNGVHHGSASFELGDPDLKQEQILNLTYSIHHRSEKWNVLINLFETFSPTFIYISPVKDSIVYTIRGPFPFFRYQASKVTLTGGDFFVQYNTTKQLGFFTKGSFIRSWNLTENDWLIFQPADQLETGIEVTSKETKRGFRFGLRFGPQWVASQSRVPEGRDFTDPPPAYFLWAAGLTVSSKKTRIPFDFSIEGQNLFNNAYRDYMNRFRYFAYDLGQNFRFRVSFFFNQVN